MPDTVPIKGGRFEMGCKPGRDDGLGMGCKSAFVHHLPEARWVDLSRVCDMGKFEVTFIEFDRFVWATGGKGFGDARYPRDGGWGRFSRPVINISWDDAKACVKWLNGTVSGGGYRLPSEAEWVYAARGDSQGPFPWGRERPQVRANFSGVAGKTVPVGSYAANSNGLHDMAGNVWEWVEDRVDDESTSRVLRGGSWIDDPEHLRATYRFAFHPIARNGGFGFRVCRSSPIEPRSTGALDTGPQKR